jgi:nucleotide-binding universal stress UspA family protein
VDHWQTIADSELLNDLKSARSIIMFPPKKILFAVDFSGRVRTMARTVRELAEQCDAEVKVLHTLTLDPNDAYAPKAAEAREKLDALISEDLVGCNLVVHLSPGDPASTIVHIARQGKTDLIMMPTRGHGAFVRSLLGSVTTRVLHDAPCPVWTSAHQQTGPAYQEHGINTILCAVDLSARSLLVLQTAVQAAQLWRARVRLAHVMELSQPSTRADWTRERRDQISSAVEGQLRQLAEAAGGMPLVEVLDGSPIKELIDAAERCHADLIVVGRTQVLENETESSSTAYGIIAGSHCPVLSV